MNPNLNLAPSFFVLITLVLYVSAAHSVRKLATLGSSEISEPPNVSPAPAPSYGWVDEKKCLSRCHDRRNLTGCLQFSPTDPGEAFLFVKNDGQSPLKLNVTISHPKTSLLDIEIPKQGTKKINISTSIGGRPLIVLNAGDGECVFLMGSVSNSDFLKHFSFYATRGTPVYGAYLLFLTVLIAGVTWACCKSRKSERQVDGVLYQDLEMAKPESLAAGHAETVEVWDQDWGDKWDETEAVKSLSKHQPENGSTNGPTSRSSDKDGWENDWDD